MNKKKIKKYFKILFVPITMLLCLLLFLINSFAQEGYVVNDNGNIESLNLFSLYYELNQGGGFGTFTRDNNHFNFNVSQPSDFYIYMPNGFSLNDGTYTISLDNYSNIEMFVLIINDNWISSSNSSHTFNVTNSDNIKIRIDANQNYVGTIEFNLMLNSGSAALDYFPVGTYYSTPQTSNFMEYLIGENYFSSGRAMVYQTNTESPYWDRQIYPTNRSCYYQIGSTFIGDYIVGKTLYLQNLTYDLIEGLKLETNYVYARNTTLSLKPSFNFANSSITYLNIPCKFLNLDIYCPNGNFEVSCYVGNGSELGSTEGNDRVYFQQSGDYIHIDFDDDDNRWMFEIEIVLNHSNNTFVAPSNIVSNTNDTLQWDLYQIGYDDGFRGAEGTISYLNYQINELTSKNNQLVESNNVLKQRIEVLEDNLSDNFGFSQVFFALADTPFKTASNMLGFELFGVNLFNALIGFITVLACIWLLKKFL